jgi:hypothetical protein
MGMVDIVLIATGRFRLGELQKAVWKEERGVL